MFKLLLLVALATLTFGFNAELDEEWEAYKQTYGKVYTGDEEKNRRTIWEDHIAYIRNHNLQADRGQHTFWLGMNKYGDMTNDEFVKVMNRFRPSNVTNGSKFLPPSHVMLPDTVDWRTEGYVTGVKDQGGCGSCWAFSTTGSLEGQHFKKTGNLVSLSEQNLMDCSFPEGNIGCEGGLMTLAFEYIIKNGGVDTEESYPYEEKEGPCRFKSENVGATCNGYMLIESGSESDLQAAVATVGPISVGMDASDITFQLYRTGIYHSLFCSRYRLNHAVLAVGYGTEDGQDYWLMKNSWGTSWGIEGYAKMSRNWNNNCGVATDASFPTV